MQSIDNYFEKYPERVFTFLIILAIPAFFINLGLLPLFADEPTRANVALEMILSKNYSVPTVGGEYYYNKPPLYNWLLAALYLISGSYSEFITRLPAEIPMFLFAITIFASVNYFLKDKRIALVSGMLFMLNGRMLLYDSMLGHIDIFYSWLTFISFMCMFYFYQRKQWFLLFLSTYIITAITFLCKGLPSIVFQGFSIITLLLYTRNFKKFFSWQHILSGIICLFIIAAYFYNYSLHNPNLEGYFATIWDQSSQRTAGRAGLAKSIKHLLMFPVEHLSHLFPVSLMLLFCFHREFLRGIRKNEFLKFICLIFLANIWVYWLSPETRPRYLLMLYPLVTIVFTHAYFTYRKKIPLLDKIVNVIFLVIGILVLLAVPIAVIAGKLPSVSFLLVKAIFITVLIGVSLLAIWKAKNYKIIPFLALLIFVRLGFSLFILPERNAKHEGNYYKTVCTEMGKTSTNAAFYFYQYHPEVVSIPFHDRLIFYIERSRGSKVKFTEVDSKPGYYLTFDRDLKNPAAVLLKTFEGNLKLFKVQ
ncbi:ArnT family glycosyltransferase [Desertivirga arenae]|uniref:ArnT family glycosyltransferase n=1 Tax=Desertivirga arenae TaxID=2810309 RepID=UPI001A96B12E|nr:hypothetical protein [Pedobacter sp. SYSU D00823]